VKQQGLPNDLIGRLKNDGAFAGIDLEGTLDARRYIGRAPEQVDVFIREQVDPVRKRYSTEVGGTAEAVRV
jgi:adenylosuccinate lyase